MTHPASVEVLKLRGTFRPDRHGSRNGNVPPPRVEKVPGEKLPAAPHHLSAAARKIWRRLVDEWELDRAGLLLLQTALEAWDRSRQARELVDAEGLVLTSVRGAKRAHPALRVEAQARTAMLAAFRQLGLEEELR